MVLETFRKNQRWLMIVIAALVIISFIWFFNRTELQKLDQGRVAQMYGRSITLPEIDRIRRKVELGFGLGLTNLTNNEIAEQQNFAWNIVVIEHEAARMGVMPAESEITETIKRLPAFQTAGQFDPTKLATFLGEKLASRGFGQKQLEDVVRLDLQIGRIRQMIESAAVVAPAEVKELFDFANTRVEAQVTRLKLADFVALVTVTDDEIKAIFEDPKKKDGFKKPAVRKVKYVTLALTEDEKKLTGPPRREALQKIADKMEALSQGMLESGASFDQIAGKLELTDKVKETPEFSDSESLARLPEGGIAGFTQAAMALNPENPGSDVLQGADTFHFLALAAWTPERPLTLEEAKPLIVKQLQEERGRIAMDLKAGESRGRIVEAMKAGKNFAEACESVGLKADRYPTFSLNEPNIESPDARNVVEATLDLADGQLSKPAKTADGSVIVFVGNRTPADEKKFETMREGMASSLRARKRQLAMHEWLSANRDAAGLNQMVELRN